MKRLWSRLLVGKLRVGNRVRLFGGYSQEPQWLNGKDAHYGNCISFIPGSNEEPAAVIRLDTPLSFEGVAGNFIVLELRYVGAQWKKQESCHAELCSVMQESRPSAERNRGLWVESHASYQVI